MTERATTAAARGAAVVSGAGSGLGRAIAVALGRRGHPLALLGRRRAPLEATLDAAGGDGRSGLVLTCDVRDPGAVAAAAATAVERLGPPEVVVPAAGRALVAPVEEAAPEETAAVVETNLLGTIHLVRALLPALRERAAGEGQGEGDEDVDGSVWIVPVLSVAARRGFPGWSAYCASKHGLAGFVAALREELAGSGVRVTALFPGAADTPLWDGLAGDWDRAGMIPPEEVARCLLAALDADPRAAVEEIHVGPAGGAL